MEPTGAQVLNSRVANSRALYSLLAEVVVLLHDTGAMR
jgi:hypothetical protein